MRILVSGATGFVGQILCKKLLQDGHEVWGLTREKDRKPTSSGLQWVRWSPYREPLAPKSVEGFDAVINLAGEPVAEHRWTSHIKKRIYDSRILGTRVLVDALRKCERKPAVFISASAVGYYGDRANEPLSDTSLPGKGFLAEVCQDWEREATTGINGARVVVLRLGVVYGKDGGALSKMLIPFRAGMGGKLANGDQWVSWIHVEDLVNLIVFSIRDPRVQGAFNAVSPEPVTNLDLTKTLSRVLGVPALVPVPLWALRLTVGEVAEILTSSQRVHPGRFLELGFQFRFSSLDLALRDLLDKNRKSASSLATC